MGAWAVCSARLVAAAGVQTSPFRLPTSSLLWLETQHLLPGPRPDPHGHPTRHRYEQVGRGMIVAVHMAAIPGTDRYLFMERPR